MTRVVSMMWLCGGSPAPSIVRLSIVLHHNKDLVPTQQLFRLIGLYLATLDVNIPLGSQEM